MTKFLRTIPGYGKLMQSWAPERRCIPMPWEEQVVQALERIRSCPQTILTQDRCHTKLLMTKVPERELSRLLVVIAMESDFFWLDAFGRESFRKKAQSLTYIVLSNSPSISSDLMSLVRQVPVKMHCRRHLLFHPICWRFFFWFILVENTEHEGKFMRIRLKWQTERKMVLFVDKT